MDLLVGHSRRVAFFVRVDAGGVLGAGSLDLRDELGGGIGLRTGFGGAGVGVRGEFLRVVVGRLRSVGVGICGCLGEAGGGGGDPGAGIGGWIGGLRGGWLRGTGLRGEVKWLGGVLGWVVGLWDAGVWRRGSVWIRLVDEKEYIPWGLGL